MGDACAEATLPGPGEGEGEGEGAGDAAATAAGDANGEAEATVTGVVGSALATAGANSKPIKASPMAEVYLFIKTLLGDPRRAIKTKP